MPVYAIPSSKKDAAASPTHWSLLGGVFVIRYGDGIVDSPIVTRRYSTVI